MDAGEKLTNTTSIIREEELRMEDFAIVDQFVGKTIGNYKIIELIGRGGMGNVYRARHTMLDKFSAFKVLHAHLSNDENALRRFRQEAESALKLDHPSIVRVTDFGVTPEGMPYLCMDFVEGTSLASIIKAEGALDPQRALRYCMQVCEALSVAHARGLVHRDIKPSNLIVTQMGDSDHIKVVDFGIAKVIEESKSPALTQTGEAMGSPPYMSPEQCQARPLDPRSDIYSLGCVLYEMLTGVRPFDSPSLFEIMNLHLNESAESVAKYKQFPNAIALDTLIGKALEKDPSKRYPSARAFADALKQTVEQLDKPATFAQRAQSFAKTVPARLRGATIPLALSALALLIAVPVCINWSSKPLNMEEFELLHQQGQELMAHQKWAEARDKYQAALKAGKDFGLENDQIQDSMRNLAVCLSHTGQGVEAASVEKQVKQIEPFLPDAKSEVENAAEISALKTEFENKPADQKIKDQLMKTMAYQARFYALLNQNKSALGCADDILDITPTTPQEIVDHAIALNVVSRVNSDLYQFEEAKKAADRVKPLVEKLSGTERDFAAAEMHDAYGRMFARQSLYTKADAKTREASIQQANQHYGRAEALFRKCFGNQSPWLADLLTSQHFLFRNTGQKASNREEKLAYYQMAADKIREAIQLNELLRGTKHPGTARSRSGLGCLYVLQANIEKNPTRKQELAKAADEELEFAINAMKNQTSHDSNQLLTSYAWRACARLSMKDLEGAERYARLAFDKARAAEPESDTAKLAYQTLLSIYMYQHRDKDVAALMRQVLPANAPNEPVVTTGK